MTDLRALVAGFAADLRESLSEWGGGADVRDVFPFVELLGEGSVARIRRASAIATGDALLDPFVDEQVLAGHRVVALRSLAVTAFARFDDLALPALYRAVAQRSEALVVTPQLAAEIRGLVILCRCAVVNGWVVWGIAREEAQRVRT